MRVVITAAAVISLGSLALVAQAPKPAATKAPYRVLKTVDGVPDLTGNWTNATYTPLERPAAFASKEYFTPEEAAAFVKTRDENFNNQASDDIHYDNVLWQ